MAFLFHIRKCDNFLTVGAIHFIRGVFKFLNLIFSPSKISQKSEVYTFYVIRYIECIMKFVFINIVLFENRALNLAFRFLRVNVFNGLTASSTTCSLVVIGRNCL